MNQRNQILSFCIVCVLLIALGFGTPYMLETGAEILIFAIFAMSLNLLLGYTGMMSFGHAAFFGIATYTVIGLGVHLGLSGWWGLLAGIAASTVLAAVIGAFCVRVTGIPFVMLTMAFSQLLYAVALKWRDLSGGSDGLNGFEQPSLFGLSLQQSPVGRYAVVAIGFIVVLGFMICLVRSPLGSIFIGIRENEQRMRAIGYPVERFRLLAFVIAGALAGIAGALYALFNAYVSPDVLRWGQSGDVMIMVVLGGAGTVVGPAIGAALYLLMKNVISTHSEYWAFWVGWIFIFCVMFMREGVWGFAAALFKRNTPCQLLARSKAVSGPGVK
ncbi:branched-chain amino acid ABC transporter permease [Paraburkholderia sp. ZP32-5]|uniref:branched-chain amino acid ABC transporter permease n=1 Tax=Paraburkholderia sp. ZP32-5 TaxID=2883245 RepID=UPI001F1DA841|nr:branched-chain amino acid ABC transporter permease [Paraburkholderia sp. ZP32-5]